MKLNVFGVQAVQKVFLMYLSVISNQIVTVRTRIIACTDSGSSKCTVDAKLSCFRQKVSHVEFWGQGSVQTPTSSSSLALPWAGNKVHIGYKAILKRIFEILTRGVRFTLHKNVTSAKTGIEASIWEQGDRNGISSAWNEP